MTASASVRLMVPLAAAAWLLAPGKGTAAEPESWQWQACGPGGGGRYLGSAISPHQPDLLLCTSDMGGVYRSEDAGRTWQMLPQSPMHRPYYQSAQPSHQWTFHPTDPKRVFVGTPFGFFRSEDAGQNWTRLTGSWDGATARGPRLIAFDPNHPDSGVALFDSTPERPTIDVYLTADGGKSWQPATALPAESGLLINARFLPAVKNSSLLVATTTSLFRSDDHAKSWQPSLSGLPEGKLTISDCVSSVSGDKATLYLTAGVADHAKEQIRDFYRSEDGGRTWSTHGRTGLFSNRSIPASFGLLGVSDKQPQIVYAVITGGDTTRAGHPGNRGGLYRSDDGGETWQPTLNQQVDSPTFNVSNTSWLTGQWGWNWVPSSLAVDPNDPNRVFITSITSALFTTDGGTTWRQVHAPEGTRDSQPAGGMLVTSAWNYYIHPKAPERHFIALTDFSGWRSLDGGATWKYSTAGNPWHNNTYAMALDPDQPDRVWAACSPAHDIPTWRYQQDLGTYPGGVVLSQDGGASWSPAAENSSLPRKAVTDIWLDPRSPAEARCLWVAVPGSGLFVSTDGGRKWSARHTGLDASNLNLLRIRGDAEGRLYALSTIRVRGTTHRAGALYTSTDNGLHWEQIFTDATAPFLTTFTLDPHAAGTVYVSALNTVERVAVGGGVWKSTDFGKTWKHIHDKPAYAVTVNPRDPQRLYLSSWYQRGNGLLTSSDGGTTWSDVGNYPFWRPTTMTFDPLNDRILYVCNFGGGVYRGTRP